MTELKSPEILAPAGTPQAAVAAIKAGADALYAGLPVLNARMMADNFTYTTFQETLNTAHAYGVKLYAVVNTLLKEDELDLGYRVLHYLDQIGVDGVILQDPGLIRLAMKYFPNLKRQVSTQLTVYGAEGAAFFDELGFTRIVLPREMSIEEAGEIRKRTKAEIKLFGHGALCYAYSGQCKFSSSLGQRSGNRGRCAQPCRKVYTLKTTDGKILKDGFLLATRDLKTIEALPELKRAGIDSLKIEGRLKSPEYVYAVTKTYKDAVRELENGEERSNHNEQDRLLKAVFQRGFTGGNLFGKEKRLTPDIGKKRGLYIGKTGEQKNGFTEVKLLSGIRIANGDGLAFGKEEKVGANVSGIFKKPDSRKSKSDYTEGSGTIWIRTNKIISVEPGTQIYRSLDRKQMEILKREASSLPDRPKEELTLDLYLYEAAPVSGTVYHKDKTYDFETDIIPEEAVKSALKEEDVLQQLKKTGGTSYFIKDIHLSMGENLFLSKSQLNQIRKQALSVLPQDDVRPIIPFEPIMLPEEEKPERLVQEDHMNTYTVELSDLVDPWDYVDLPVDEIILPLGKEVDFERIEPLIQAYQRAGKKVYLTGEQVLSTEDTDAIRINVDKFKSLFLKADGFLLKNYEMLKLLIEMGLEKREDFTLEADDSFNLMNTQTAEFLKGFGVDSALLSTEMQENEIVNLLPYLPLIPSILVYGRRKLMTSAYCVFDCVNRDCKTCQNNGRYTLTNGDKDYPLLVKSPLNEIYDEAVQVLPPSKIKNLNAKRRLYVFDEPKEQIEKILQSYKRGKDITIPGSSPSSFEIGVL